MVRRMDYRTPTRTVFSWFLGLFPNMPHTWDCISPPTGGWEWSWGLLWQKEGMKFCGVRRLSASDLTALAWHATVPVAHCFGPVGCNSMWNSQDGLLSGTTLLCQSRKSTKMVDTQKENTFSRAAIQNGRTPVNKHNMSNTR